MAKAAVTKSKLATLKTTPSTEKLVTTLKVKKKKPVEKDKPWLTIEFRCENDYGINDLKVIATHCESGTTLTQTTQSGQVAFENIEQGAWRISVEQQSLLSIVETFASRSEDLESPVEQRVTESNNSQDKNLQYKLVTVGDLWDSEPDDNFLIKNHKGIDPKYSSSNPGIELTTGQDIVLEIKALRSYIPCIIDTDEFSLVNSYTFALLSQLAYADDRFGDISDTDNPKLPEGSFNKILQLLQAHQKPQYSASDRVDWLLKEIPYSQHLSGKFLADKNLGAEGYILTNSDIVIIGVRGTQVSFKNELKSQTLLYATGGTNSNRFNPIMMNIRELEMEVIAAFDSPGYKDIATDLSAAQIQVVELNNTYLHKGFYDYAMALWPLIDELYSGKQQKVYVCGHSLGGAGALILSSLIRNKYRPKTLRLYTYGMPRTGTFSFVKAFNDIVHYRHVNNHDLVPQIPKKWMNTSGDQDLIWRKEAKASIPFYFLLDDLIPYITDHDDDNFHHHGSLVQLLTYGEHKHHPGKVEQVLLTPKQSHITSLTSEAIRDKDAYALRNLYSVSDLFLDHKMSEYLPNLYQQLQILSENSLSENYASVTKNLKEAIVGFYEKVTDLGMEEAEILHSPSYSAENALREYRQLDKIRKEKDTLDHKLFKSNQLMYKEMILLQKETSIQTNVNTLLTGGQPLTQEIKAQLP